MKYLYVLLAALTTCLNAQAQFLRVNLVLRGEVSRLCLVLLLVVAAMFARAQSPQTRLVLRGESNLQPRQLVSCSDGGYLMSGIVNSVSGPTGQDLFIAKFDHNLNFVWRKVMGTPRHEGATAIMETSTHDIVVAYSACDSMPVPNGDFAAMRILKLDASGNMRWVKSYYHNKYCTAWAITNILETPDGKYAIFNDPYVLTFGEPVGVFVTDTSGNIASYKQIRNGSSIDLPRVAKLGNSFVIAGVDDVISILNNSIMYALCDASGTVRQSRRYVNGDDLGVVSINATPDGKVLIIGGKSALSGTVQYFLKVDTTGSLIWSKKYLGKDTTFTTAFTSGNRMFLAGYCYIGGTANANAHVLVAEMDTAGNFVWAKAAPVPNGFMHAVYDASSNTVVVGGLYYLAPYPGFLMRIDMSPTLSCNELPITLQTQPYGIVGNATGTVNDTVSTYAVPTPSFTAGGGAIVSDSLLCGTSVSVAANSAGGLRFNVYPNPLQSGSRLLIEAPLTGDTKLEIYDLSGKMLFSRTLFTTLTVTELRLPGGLYFVRVVQRGQVGVQKLLVQE